MMPPALPPVPKLRDAARTRKAILRAGQKLFALKGYSPTGVREVAAEAGVNSSLVRRYFGSKEGLLRAALEDVLKIAPLITGERAAFGRRVVDIFLAAEAIPSPVAMMLLATTDASARILCRDLIESRIIIPLAAWLGGANANDRAARLHIVWMGFITARQLLPLKELSDRNIDATRRWLERLTQAIADELPEPGTTARDQAAAVLHGIE